MMRKWIVLGLLCAMLIPTPAALGSEALSVDAKAAVLIDAGSGRILFAQNADERLPMASTTKIMTALIALENSRLDETVTAGPNASGVEGTSIYLSEGEQLSMEHLLYGLMLRSGNDAAVAIAEHVAGSVSAFTDKMNARAAELDADAHFVNPHGLPAEGHAASALGMARIMRQAMTNPDFVTITGTRRKVIPWVGNEYSRVLENKNRLLTTYDGATGGKTGFTSKAGRCLVFSAERDGLALIGVVLNCPTWFDTAETLLDFGFENYRAETVLLPGQSTGAVPVSGGAKDSIPVQSGGTLTSAVALGSGFTVRYEYRDDLAAPILKGDVVGVARMICNGETLSSCPLLAAEDVDEWNFAAALKSVLRNWLLSLGG